MKSNELLSEVNKVEFENSLNHLIKELINWKTNNSFVHSSSNIDSFIRTGTLPLDGQVLNDSIEEVIDSLDRNINFSSNKFMGFPDSGNSRPYNLMCKDEQFLKVNQNWV